MKQPDSDVSIPMELQIFDESISFENASDFMKFTASVASSSMLITDSAYKGNSDFVQVVSWLNSTNLNDEHNFKDAFKGIVEDASGL